MVEGWERSETTDKIPYYVNHNTSKTQWDHPWYIKTLEDLGDMDTVKYAAYRTALKLRFLQKKFALDLIDLRTINVVFDRHGYRDHNDSVLDCAGLYSILVEICNTNRLQHASGNVSVDTVVEMLFNWLLNLYDMNRTGCLRVISVKVALGVLCYARITDKYKFFFRELRDSTEQISRKRMAMFLHDIMQIPHQINEASAFGGINITPALKNCFSMAWNAGQLTEDEFLRWLLKEPQTLVWLPTMHRLAASETVHHEAKCSICKALPIIGFRYRCLKCFNYDLCQMCFFTGRISKKHKLKHPTQEYCVATTTKQDTKDFMKTVRNNLSKKHRNKKKQRYLPINDSGHYGPQDELGETPESSPHTDTSVPGHSPVGYPDLDQGDLEDEEEEEEEEEDPEQILEEEEEDIPTHAQKPPLSDDSFNAITRQLEFENRNLQEELEHLQQVSRWQPASSQYPQRRVLPPEKPVLPSRGPVLHPVRPLIEVPRSPSPDLQSGSEASEVEWLRDEKDRLEAKQEVLEAHNKQLELQLYRLRLLVKQDDNQGPASLQNTSTPMPPTLVSPKHPPPPPYQATPTGIALGHSMLLAHPSAQALVDKFSLSANEDHGYNTPDIGMDTTYGDSALGQTHFSLPSPDQSRCFPDEEAELEQLIDKLNKVYPSDMTHSLLERSQDALEEMYSAANKIGDAFSGFVGNLQDKEYSYPEEEDSEGTEQESETDDQTDDQNSTLPYTTHHQMSACAET